MFDIINIIISLLFRYEFYIPTDLKGKGLVSPICSFFLYFLLDGY